MSAGSVPPAPQLPFHTNSNVTVPVLLVGQSQLSHYSRYLFKGELTLYSWHSLLESAELAGSIIHGICS